MIIVVAEDASLAEAGLQAADSRPGLAGLELAARARDETGNARSVITTVHAVQRHEEAAETFQRGQLLEDSAELLAAALRDERRSERDFANPALLLAGAFGLVTPAPLLTLGSGENSESDGYVRSQFSSRCTLASQKALRGP